MPEPTEISKFGFGIKIVKHFDGKIEYQTQSANKRVPIEIIIMQMKAFLNNLEKNYFDNFNKRASK